MQGPSNRMFWVGYTKFFDTSTKDCDAVTWSFSREVGFRQYLTQDRRTKMNALVDLVNDKIEIVCSDAGPQCVCVDPQADVDAIKGRYCEPGVNEKYWGGSPDGWNREETVYYEWSTTKDDDYDHDKGRDENAKRADKTYNSSNDTFEGAVANWIN
ncbi:MAG: hypothetical protein M1830_002216 [Pleopsidium flavum]|nr:MAG: hypothetical protein M1830_002216 [Pleopsidium flavum]